MYTEFKIIYVGLGILAVLLLAVIVLLIILLKKLNTSGQTYSKTTDRPSQSYAPRTAVSGIVFCPGCGTQFDAKHTVCPKCGKPR